VKPPRRPNAQYSSHRQQPIVSSGETTATVYDWRVGTSICEMLNRKSKTMIANGSVGMSGTRISKILEGTWVRTIVLIRPILFANRTASKAEIPARNIGPEENRADDARINTKLDIEPVSQHGLGRSTRPQMHPWKRGH